MNKYWYIVDENGYPIASFVSKYIAEACQKYFKVKTKVKEYEERKINIYVMG